MKTLAWAFLGVATAWGQTAWGQTAWGQAAEDSLRHDAEPPRFSALPTAYYTPETRIALEAFALCSFRSDSAARSSNARVFAAVTQNRQLTVDLPWQVFTRAERFRVDGKLDVRKFPEYYYGLGNDTEEDARRLYEYRGVGLRNSALKQVGNNIYAGIYGEGRWLDTDSLPSFDAVETPLLGAQGYRYVGIGPSFVHDSRDVILCASKGSYFETFATWNVAWFPSEREGASMFWMLGMDHRRFFCVKPGTVLAYQVVGRSALGSVPYRELPALGGPLLHRGYYFGRFRDRHMWCAQFEARQSLFWRIGGVAFASAGRVYSDLLGPWLQGVKPAAGVGLRFKLNAEEEANIRLDVAMTPDSHGIYVYFAEVF